MRPHLLVASFSTAVLLAVTPGIARSQTLTTIDVPGASVTAALGINDRGEVVGEFAATASDYTNRLVRGFLRSRGQLTVIEVPGSSSTSAAGINTRGQIAGSYCLGDIASGSRRCHGFLLDRGQFTTIDPPDASQSAAYGINDLGEIVGNYEDAGGQGRGFLWTHGHFITIDSPSGLALTARGINRSGQLVGSYVIPEPPKEPQGPGDTGFRLQPRGDFTQIRQMEWHTVANGINDRGEIVGYSAIPNQVNMSGFLLAFGTVTSIDIAGEDRATGIPSGHTAANGINNRGQIVGLYRALPSTLTTQYGFLLTPAGEVEDVSGNASADRTRVPEASVVFDDQLAMWTLGPGEEILRDGVQAAGGYGSRILWFQGAIYVLGDDSNWWRWTGSTWTFAGPTDPAS